MNGDLSPRLTPSPPGWAAIALADPAALLSDHAHCERKAASTALALLGSCGDDPDLAMRLARLAEQETEHLRRVLEAMDRLAITLLPDRGNPYAKALMSAVRRGDVADRIMAAAMIEARSHERLELLLSEVGHHPDLELLAPLLRELAACESGHASLYITMAARRLGPDRTATELRRWESIEAEAIAGVTPRAAVH